MCSHCPGRGSQRYELRLFRVRYSRKKRRNFLRKYYWALFILSLFTILLPLITIFLYKKRFLQVRLCIVEIVLLIGSGILMWYHIRQFGADATVLYKFSFILPVVCIIFTYMAIRGIVKDIKLLKSYDRIR